jgi:DNA polymerase-3 subunit alpha
MTKKIHLGITLQALTEEIVNFLEDNIRKNPGSTELMITVKDVEKDMTVRLKSQNRKILLSDELIAFLTEHEEINYSIEKNI